MDLSCLICIYMYIHVYMFIPMLFLYVHMCTDIFMYVHICTHWHIYSFFVCTYKSIQRVIFWLTKKSISCDTNEISSRVNSFYQTHESILLTRHIYLTMFPNIQDQFLYAMKSDTLDPRTMEGNVQLPEDETKCNRKFTQMSISVAGYPSMEWYI